MNNVVIEVKRKKGESTEALLRRFSQRVQQSRILIKCKEAKFYAPILTKREIRERALRKEKTIKKREYLRRIGKLEETERKRKK